MTLDERIQELKDKNERLTRLLADPQPGLGTWAMMVSRALDSLAEHAPSYEKVK